MSKESANQFLEAAAQHTNLREHFHSVAAPEEFIEVAEKLGYTFTTEELREALKEHSQGVNLRRRTGVWPWLRSVKWL
jgi:predicted ribosomally synthesized peptide with nif11-like leader